MMKLTMALAPKTGPGLNSSGGDIATMMKANGLVKPPMSIDQITTQNRLLTKKKRVILLLKRFMDCEGQADIGLNQIALSPNTVAAVALHLLAKDSKTLNLYSKSSIFSCLFHYKKRQAFWPYSNSEKTVVNQVIHRLQ